MSQTRRTFPAGSGSLIAAAATGARTAVPEQTLSNLARDVTALLPRV